VKPCAPIAVLSAMELVSTKIAKPKEANHLFIGPLWDGISVREESNAVCCHQEGNFL
jgi:hypothetical protein